MRAHTRMFKLSRDQMRPVFRGRLPVGQGGRRESPRKMGLFRMYSRFNLTSIPSRITGS